MGRAARVEKGWIVHSHWQAGRSADRVRGWSPEFGEQKEKAAAVPRPGEGLECLAPWVNAHAWYEAGSRGSRGEASGVSSRVIVDVQDILGLRMSPQRSQHSLSSYKKGSVAKAKQYQPQPK